MNYPDHFLYGLNPAFPQPPHCLHLGWGEGTGCPGHSRVLSGSPALYLPEASGRSPSLGQPKRYPDTAKRPCAGGWGDRGQKSLLHPSLSRSSRAKYPDRKDPQHSGGKGQW